MRVVFVDANEALRGVAERLKVKLGASLPAGFDLRYGPAEVEPEALPELIGDASLVWVDHTALPTEVARRCDGLRHVVFLGTGARSYMDPEALAEIGIEVHLIRGYGDTAVAECAISLLFAAARGTAAMDRAMRSGEWLRREGTQLAGKTLGLIGFGGIAREVARLALGIGMRVVAWNRSPQAMRGVEFVSIERLLAESDAVSMHLLLDDETRGFLSRERVAAMRLGVLFVNTARGALADEAAMIDALRSGQIGHAGLDVFEVEPLPVGHALTQLDNVTLSAHSGFRTAEASDRLIEAAYAHCVRIVGSTEPAQ